jgi:hypothetical protein
MIIKKQNVKYQFLQYSSTTTDTLQVNLVLNGPASVQFICKGPATIGRVLINNIYNLDSVESFISGVAKHDYQLILNNNINEIDTTNYTILLKPQTTVSIICKYINQNN